MPDSGASARVAFAATSTTDPNDEAGAQQLSQQTGMGVYLVRSNPAAALRGKVSEGDWSTPVTHYRTRKE